MSAMKQPISPHSATPASTYRGATPARDAGAGPHRRPSRWVQPQILFARRHLARGQSTVEYALLVVGIATLALLVLAWASSTGSPAGSGEAPKRRGGPPGGGRFHQPATGWSAALVWSTSTVLRRSIDCRAGGVVAGAGDRDAARHPSGAAGTRPHCAHPPLRGCGPPRDGATRRCGGHGRRCVGSRGWVRVFCRAQRVPLGGLAGHGHLPSTAGHRVAAGGPHARRPRGRRALGT